MVAPDIPIVFSFVLDNVPILSSCDSRPDTKDRARSGKVIESTELRNDFHS